MNTLRELYWKLLEGQLAGLRSLSRTNVADRTQYLRAGRSLRSGSPPKPHLRCVSIRNPQLSMCVGHWQPRLRRRCQAAWSGLMIAAEQLTHVQLVWLRLCLVHTVTGFWRHLFTLHAGNEDIGWFFKLPSVSWRLQILLVRWEMSSRYVPLRPSGSFWALGCDWNCKGTAARYEGKSNMQQWLPVVLDSLEKAAVLKDQWWPTVGSGLNFFQRQLVYSSSTVKWAGIPMPVIHTNTCIQRVTWISRILPSQLLGRQWWKRAGSPLAPSHASKGMLAFLLPGFATSLCSHSLV